MKIPTSPVCFVILASIFQPTSGAAQSAEEQVEDAIRSMYMATNNGDASAFWSFLATGDPEHAGSFPRNGLVLGPPAAPAPEMQADFDEGSVAFDVNLRDLHVTVYGTTAVATYYTTGSSRVPGQRESVTGTFRVTNVWVRQGQDWKQVHAHISPLET